MSSSEEHHHKHTSTREEDQSTDTYREGFQKGQHGGDRGLVSEYDGGNAGRTGQGSGNTSDRYGEGRDTSSGTDYKSSGTKGYDSGPVSAPAHDGHSSGHTGGHTGGSPGLSGGSSGGNKHYGLDDGYVTRDMSVLGIQERGGGQNVGMSSGGGALNEYGSSGTGTGTGASHGTGHGAGHQGSGVHFSEGTGGSGGGGGGREYTSIQSELGPAGVGPNSSRGHEYASGGMGGQGYDTGSVGSGSAGGLQTGGIMEADQVEGVHAASKPPSKVKQVMGKVMHHKAKGPYDSSPQTGPAAFTPMSTAIAGGVRPRPEAHQSLDYHPHGMPETEQSVGALGHNKTKLKHLEQM